MTKAAVVELAGHRAQACFDVPQALAVSQASEGHRQVLIPISGDIQNPQLELIILLPQAV